MSVIAPSPARTVERETRYFVVRCGADSYAAGQLDALSKELDRAAAWLLDRLKAGRELAVGPGKLVVEALDAPPQGPDGAPGPLGSRGDPVAGLVQTVYTAASPGKDLVYQVARLLVCRWARPPEGWSVAEGQPPEHWCYAPTFLADGLARHLTSEYAALGKHPLFDLESRQSADHVSRESAASREGKVPLYECLMRGPATADNVPEFEALQESFCGYVFQRDGPGRYRAVTRDSAEEPNLITDLVYGKSLEQLQDEWLHALLRGLTRRPMSLKGFVKLAVPYLRPYWVLVLISLLLMCISAVSSLYTPFAVQRVLDFLTQAIRTGADLEESMWTFGGILATWAGWNLIFSITTMLLVYNVNVIGQNVLRDMRVSFLEHTQRLSEAFYARNRIGDMIARFTSDIARLADPMTDAVSYSVYYTILLVAAINAMFILSWQLSLLLFIIVPIYVWSGRWLGPAIQKVSRERQERLAQLNAHLEEALYGHALVKIYNLRHYVNHYFKPEIGQYRKIAIWTNYLTSIYRETLHVVDNIQTKLVLGFGGYLALTNQISVGTIFGFNIAMGRFLTPLGRFSIIYASISIAAASMRRLQEVIREPPEKLETPKGGREAPGAVRDGITFDNVCFTYGGPDLTLKDIDLHIQAGETVAFVGPTGAGKTTLAGLVPRFYDVLSGTVRIDGEDIRHFSLGGLRSQISIVSQDTFLFNTTIRENIRLGRLSASDEEVVEAAKQARLHDFVMTLPSQYDTIVGERGVRLSGGQRQRVSIARAMLRNSPIVILDEATSALDAETESEILQELDQVTAGKTVITITHRLALAMRADRICVLEAGEVCEQGTHRELMEQRGLYYRLFEEQNQALIASEAEQQVDEAFDRLRRVPLFSLLPCGAVERLGGIGDGRRYGPGEPLGGNGSGGLYLLRSGQVELRLEQPDEVAGACVQAGPPADGQPGAVVLLNLPPGMSARAVTAAQVHALDPADAFRLLRNGRADEQRGAAGASGQADVATTAAVLPIPGSADGEKPASQ